MVNATPRVGGDGSPGDRYGGVARVARATRIAAQPTISVDTKKKELIGGFKNAGRSKDRRIPTVAEPMLRIERKGQAAPDLLC